MFQGEERCIQNVHTQRLRFLETPLPASVLRSLEFVPGPSRARPRYATPIAPRSIQGMANLEIRILLAALSVQFDVALAPGQVRVNPSMGFPFYLRHLPILDIANDEFMEHG